MTYVIDADLENNVKTQKVNHGYTKRWIAEIVSSFKANFGEYVLPRKMKNIKQEIITKVLLYNMLWRNVT